MQGRAGRVISGRQGTLGSSGPDHQGQQEIERRRPAHQSDQGRKNQDPRLAGQPPPEHGHSKSEGNRVSDVCVVHRQPAVRRIHKEAEEQKPLGVRREMEAPPDVREDHNRDTQQNQVHGQKRPANRDRIEGQAEGSDQAMNHKTRSDPLDVVAVDLAIEQRLRPLRSVSGKTNAVPPKTVIGRDLLAESHGSEPQAPGDQEKANQQGAAGGGRHDLRLSTSWTGPRAEPRARQRRKVGVPCLTTARDSA